MNTLLSKYLAPLTLLEWGGIMLYFYLSGRIAAFLHPMFQPMVLVAGILLAITAFVLLFSKTDCCGGHGDEEEGHSHSHEHSAGRNVTSFVILLLPIALAAGISPDSYGVNMVRNRGVIANNAALPKSKPMPPAEAAVPAATPATYVGVDNAKTNTPTNQTLAVGEPALPTEDGKPDPNAAAAPSGGFQNPSLKVNARGHIDADVLDLMYASEEASMMKDFDGKQVEVIGQVVHRKEAEHEKGPFQVIRFLMSCCAADARPVAVLVDYSKKEPDFKSMTWVKVTGKVEFRKAGSTTYPVITPTLVKETDAPADMYLY